MASGRMQDLGRLARGVGLVAAQGLGELSNTQAAQKALGGNFAGAILGVAKGGAELVASMPGTIQVVPNGPRRHSEPNEHGVRRDYTQPVVTVDQTVATAVKGGLDAAQSAGSQAGFDEYMHQAAEGVRSSVDTVAGSIGGSSRDAEQSVKSMMGALEGQRPLSEVGALLTGTGTSLKFEAVQSSVAEGIGNVVSQFGHAISQVVDPGRGAQLEERVGDAVRQVGGALPLEQREQLKAVVDSISAASSFAARALHPESQLRRVLNGSNVNLQPAGRKIADLPGRGAPPGLREGLEQMVNITKEVDRQLGLRGELERAGKAVFEALSSSARAEAGLRKPGAVRPITANRPAEPGFGAEVWSSIENQGSSEAGTASDVATDWAAKQGVTSASVPKMTSASAHGLTSEGVMTLASSESLAAGTHNPEERLAKLKAMPASEHADRPPSKTDTGTVTYVAPGYKAKPGVKSHDSGRPTASRSEEPKEFQREGRNLNGAVAALGLDTKVSDAPTFERRTQSPAAGEGLYVPGTGGLDGKSTDHNAAPIDEPKTSSGGRGFNGLGSPNGNSTDGNAAAINEPQVAHSKEARARARAEESKRKEVERRTKQARERKVPSGPMARVFGFGQMAAGMAFGTLGESAGRLLFGGASPGGNAFMSEGNAERLAAGLARMRGAALKLGQMLSIQDESIIPPQIARALERVRQGADIMPRKQLERVLAGEMGPNWKAGLAEFDDLPMAAASIGQVHHATLKEPHAGGAFGSFREVAMKVQYPGVSESIESDIENMRRILDWTDVIPKGMYLDHAIKIAKVELAAECDYILEAQSQKRYRELLGNDPDFYVPQVVDSLCKQKVLTTELVPGSSIDNVARMDEATRNRVATRLLRLTLKELFEFRFMQTDPNWGNFLYDEERDRIYLIDFGAARDFPKVFVDNYLEMVRACADKDKEKVIEYSKRLGFLTGDESRVMLDAHCQAAFVVGVPFAKPGGFDFKTTDLTKRVTALGAVMLRHRLTPPPDEAYSLHRKLSGAFLACIKLGATVPCRELFFDIYDNYGFGSAPVAATA